MDIIRLSHDQFDPSNITFKNMKARMIYPMYKSLESDSSTIKANPIIIETPFVTLNEYPICKYDLTHPIFNLYQKVDETMSQEMKMIFNLFNSIDEYTKTNLSEIKRLDNRIKDHVSYVNCIRKKNMKGNEYSYIKFKLNLNLGEDCTKSDSTKQNNSSKKSILPVIKLYYRSKYITLYKIHSLAEASRILRPGRRVRFIIAINRFWFNDNLVGYSSKIMQMEVDNSISNKYDILRSLKNNDTNMFNKFSNTTDRNKYDEYIERSIKFGSSRLQKKKSNDKIIKLINKSNLFNDKNLFNDIDDEYESLSIIV